MLIDIHAHSSEISRCCKANAKEVLEAARGVGLDGIALTNHYAPEYITDGDYDGFARRYVDAYYYTRKIGEAMGMKVFFGIEVSVAYQKRVHLVIYGVDTDFILKHPRIFDYSQAEIYRIVHESGGVLVQAHPFRYSDSGLQDLRFLDALEVNSHPLYKKSGTKFKELSEIASSVGLILTSGGDYHADTHRPHCGMYLPDSIRDGVELGQYLKNADSVELLIAEPHETVGKKVFFKRKK